VCKQPVKGSKKDLAAICGNFIFQHFHSPFCIVWTALWKGSSTGCDVIEEALHTRRVRGRAE
jgi:hypothetical protein